MVFTIHHKKQVLGWNESHTQRKGGTPTAIPSALLHQFFYTDKYIEKKNKKHLELVMTKLQYRHLNIYYPILKSFEGQADTFVLPQSGKERRQHLPLTIGLAQAL